MKISNNIKKDIQKKISTFNTKNNCEYHARYRGGFLYLDLQDGHAKPSPICRLTFTGNMEKWDFAIYKYSDNKYDPDEWIFPGSECIDGTLEGAMQAGLEAYG